MASEESKKVPDSLSEFASAIFGSVSLKPQTDEEAQKHRSYLTACLSSVYFSLCEDLPIDDLPQDQKSCYDILAALAYCRHTEMTDFSDVCYDNFREKSKKVIGNPDIDKACQFYTQNKAKSYKNTLAYMSLLEGLALSYDNKISNEQNNNLVEFLNGEFSDTITRVNQVPVATLNKEIFSLSIVLSITSEPYILPGVMKNAWGAIEKHTPSIIHLGPSIAALDPILLPRSHDELFEDMMAIQTYYIMQQEFFSTENAASHFHGSKWKSENISRNRDTIRERTDIVRTIHADQKAENAIEIYKTKQSTNIATVKPNPVRFNPNNFKLN